MKQINVVQNKGAIASISSTSEHIAEEEITAEGTETVPSVPYTLGYTVKDLTEDIPRYPANEKGFYAENGGISYRNAYVKNGTFYVYSDRNNDRKTQPRLLPYTAEGFFDEDHCISVPMVHDTVPLYAYFLNNQGFALLSQQKYKNEENSYTKELYFTVTDSGGSILAEYKVSDDFSHTYTENALEYLICEDNDGNVLLLITNNHRNDKIILFTYYADAGEIVLNRVFYDNGILHFKISECVYIGNNRFLCMGTGQDSTVLDMDTACLKKHTFRIPENKQYMSFSVDEEGNLYLFDLIGLYRFNGNHSPILAAEWGKCGVSPTSYDRNLWMIDDHTFYIDKEVTVNQKVEHHLYYIQTERVPATKVQKTITLGFCNMYDDWLNEAIQSFNAQSEDYRVVPEYYDHVNKNAEEYSADLRDRIMYEAHPDMMLTVLKYVALDEYCDKGLFLDVSEEMSGVLLGCVAEAMRTNGALYSVPMNFQMQTFVSLPEQETDFLRWETFFHQMDTLKDGEVLTSDSSVIQQIFDNGIMDFYHREKKEAFYDSRAFQDTVLYTKKMEEWIDSTAGYLIYQSDGTFGYTNPTLPRRIAEGGLKYLSVWIQDINILTGLKLLYGDNGYTFCGYPSNGTGSAYLNLHNRVSIFADTDVKDGCIEFLSYLLSDAQQTSLTHADLPVTDSGMRVCIAKNRYSYYPADRLNDIGDPAATLYKPSLVLGSAEPVGYIPLSPSFSTDAPIDIDAYIASGTVTDPDTGLIIHTPSAPVMVELTDAEIENFLYFLNNCHMKANTDPTLRTIVEEELSYWQGGVSSLADAGEKIQSRVWIYLNE